LFIEVTLPRPGGGPLGRTPGGRRLHRWMGLPICLRG